MNVMSLKEVHQKLSEYGVTEKVLAKLPVSEAMHLLHHKSAELKQYVDYDPDDFVSALDIEKQSVDSAIEESYERSVS